MLKFVSTEEFARMLAVKPETCRRNLCLKGHFLGVVPRKLPNRRLLWPVAEVEKLTGQIDAE